MTVFDASVVVEALAVTDPIGGRARVRLTSVDRVNAPAILRAEIVSGLRRMALAGVVTDSRLRMALVQCRELNVVEFPFGPFQDRVWELRENLGVYDAWYVALAEELDTELVTSDRRLATAPGIRCEVDLIGSSGSASR